MKGSSNFPNVAYRNNINNAFESSRDRSVQELGSVKIPLKSWREVERAMDRARDLRALHCAALLTATFRRIRIGLFGRTSVVTSSRPKAVARFVLVACGVALAAVGIFSGAVFAEEARKMSARSATEIVVADDTVLSELGLTTAAIEDCADVELLWRAVRELVLPQRVSEPMQQKILRRVWIVDPAVRVSSFVDSATN